MPSMQRPGLTAGFFFVLWIGNRCCFGHTKRPLFSYGLGKADHERDEIVPNARARNFVEGFRQLVGITFPEQLDGSAPARGRFHAVVERRDGYLEKVRDNEQPSGSYPVRPFLVFLNLLKGDAEMRRHVGL